MRKKLAIASTLSAPFLALVSKAYAEPQVNIGPALQRDVQVSDVIQWVITAFFVIGILAALFFILWGGLNWILSGGDKDKVEAARSRIIAAIIGLVVIVLAFFILDFVLQLLGFCGLRNFTIPSLGGTKQLGACQ